MATWAHPFPGAVVTTHYGAPNAANGAPHTGVDYAYGGSSCGRRVLAARAGTARRAENVGGGHGVLIDHGDGTESGYWHLSSQLVADGQRVSQGQLIGLAGASGTLVRGCHLHFELKANGANVNPEPVIGAAHVAAVPQGAPDSFPIDQGMTCPPGYVMGRVNPRAHAFPGSPWWNRPVDANGTALACIRSGLQPGDNTALTDVGEGVTQALTALLPVAANGLVIILALFIGWQGVRRIIGP